jgi:hypothetical protein
MPVMHEQMHQRAGGQQQEGQHAVEMRRMFGDEEEGSDGKEAA